jgi:hypothetical protein
VWQLAQAVMLRWAANAWLCGDSGGPSQPAGWNRSDEPTPTWLSGPSPMPSRWWQAMQSLCTRWQLWQSCVFARASRACVVM